MESDNYLGIYISKDTATVVCVNSQGNSENIAECFSVSAQEQDAPKIQTLGNLIAKGCAERNLAFSDVAVALDCAMFMQHSVNSEFTDTKQITATIRFDTEEALATDITDIALAFEITSIKESGSILTVYTAQRKILSEVLLALEQNNLDPITMEPDVICLSRLISRKTTTDQSREGSLFAMLSGRSGYLTIPPPSAGTGSRKSSVARTFLVGPKQNRTELLAREVLMTMALAQSDEPIRNLRVFDSAGKVDNQPLGERLGFETAGVDWLESPSGNRQNPDDSVNQVDLAIAYGAALSLVEKDRSVNFRDDFSPYQGKKIKAQNALKFASVCLTILLIAVGMYFQTLMFFTNKDGKNLENRFSMEYSAVAQQNLAESLTIKNAVSELRKLQRKIEAQRKGIDTDQTSILSKLTLVLSAFNKCADKTDLNIKRLTISSQNISISGDTSGRQQTTLFFNQLSTSGFVLDRPFQQLKGNRDSFSISVKPGK